MIGKILNGRYEIVELIGRGGMAYVYKAKDLKLGRFVAVKILREEYTDDEQFIRKFDRESQAAAGLSDPNIVSVYDVGVDGDIYFIVMEYVNGITLKQYLSKKGRLDYEEATNFIIDIAEALRCAHEHGIIHRDIKPQNIMLTQDLTPKVTDFGIARAITSATITMTNQTMGSVHYISPEQARGGFVDERSDLYSLGIMYYELLTGELPFDEDSTVSIAIKHIQEDITPPIEVVPDIPKSVSDVVVKLCQKKPEDRYQDCEELIADLDRIMMDSSVNIAGSTPNSGLIDENNLFEKEPDTSKSNDSDADLDVLRKKKKRRKIIIAVVIAIAAALVIALIALASTSTSDVTVPDVTGMTRKQAKAALEAVGLEIEVQSAEYSDTVDKGKVISQSPESGSTTQTGKTVRVVLSRGKERVTVPNVIGMTESEATAAIEAAGLKVGDTQEEYNSNYASGEVYNVSPSVSTTVDADSEVTLYISKGKETASVPGLIGLTQSDATSRISANGFILGSVSRQYSDNYASGVVISQSPSEGSTAEKGSSISIVVSQGKDPSKQQQEQQQQQQGTSGGDSGSSSSSGGSSSSTSTTDQ